MFRFQSSAPNAPQHSHYSQPEMEHVRTFFSLYWPFRSHTESPLFLLHHIIVYLKICFLKPNTFQPGLTKRLTQKQSVWSSASCCLNQAAWPGEGITSSLSASSDAGRARNWPTFCYIQVQIIWPTGRADQSHSPSTWRWDKVPLTPSRSVGVVYSSYLHSSERRTRVSFPKWELPHQSVSMWHGRVIWIGPINLKMVQCCLISAVRIQITIKHNRWSSLVSGAHSSVWQMFLLLSVHYKVKMQIPGKSEVYELCLIMSVIMVKKKKSVTI